MVTTTQQTSLLKIRSDSSGKLSKEEDRPKMSTSAQYDNFVKKFYRLQEDPLTPSRPDSTIGGISSTTISPEDLKALRG